jgi:CzcA family heavy metal efflux pump
MIVTNVSLAHKTSIFVLLFIVVISGFVSYISLPLESFPDITQPVVFVAAPYIGVAPVDMETLVVKPIEDRLQEITKIKKLTSRASEGYASIVAEFEPDIEVDEALRKVREKVDQAKQDLPDDLDDPVVEEINFENIPIMIISIYGEQSLVRLKKVAEDLQDKIEDIPGVLSVDLSGGLEREVKVNVIPSRLIYYNLGVDDVIEAIESENLTIPGGSTESSSLKWTIRVPGEYQSLDELKNTVVDARGGAPIYLQDLAEVEFGFKEQTSYSRLSGKSSVTLAIQKRTGENIIRITDAVKAILNEESPLFPQGTEYSIVSDFSKEIRTMVNELENNIIAGLLLVILVLYFFMGGRNGLLVAVAIPISMLISFVVISLLGYTLNMIVLFSLILSLGMLVDNAVVIVENIYRQHQEGKDLLTAARDATSEVGSAVIVSTLTTLMAFLPLLFWQGIIGEFMKFLPITLIITLSSSLLVGLIINPVIASSFLRIDKKAGKLPGDRLLKWLSGRYESTLRWAFHSRQRRIAVLSLTAFAFVLMFVLYGRFNHGIEFFPSFDPSELVVEVEAPLGTRLEVSDAVVKEIEERVRNLPDLDEYVADVGSTSGFFSFGGSADTHKSQVTVALVDKRDREQSSLLTQQQLNSLVSGIPGPRIEVVQQEMGPPTGKAVEIQVRGEDFSVLAKASEEIQRRLRNVPGISNIDSDYEQGRPELRIVIDREKAALLGLNTAQVAGTIRTAINGTEASEYRVGTDEYDITVRYKVDYRKSYTDLLNLTIFYEGRHYPLANFATVELATGLSSVSHVGGERVVTITADAFGKSEAEVLADTKRRLADYEPPSGYNITYAGQDEEQRESQMFLMRAFMIALLLIFLLLVTQFNSVTLPFVILITVLLSFFGVFLGLLITFKPFGIIMTGIGIISLAGVVVNNAIVLIDYIQKLRARGMDKTEAIVQGGKTRLRPVLMTAITTILGLIPLTTGITIDFKGALSGNFSHFIEIGAESSQWWSGMGVVVIFGLLFATLLTLVVVPVLYHILSDLLSDVAARIKSRQQAS